jgi:hypothetical protein
MNRHDIVRHLQESRNATIVEYNGSKSNWDKSYAPGKWTIRQMLVHMADVEMVHLWRLSRAWAEPGSPVYAFDHDRWVTELRYDERPIQICRDMFLGIRNQIIYYVETQPDSAFDNTVNHSEAGVIPVTRILNYLVYHTEHHLEQIRFAREGKVWTPEAAVIKP